MIHDQWSFQLLYRDDQTIKKITIHAIQYSPMDLLETIRLVTLTSIFMVNAPVIREVEMQEKAYLTLKLTLR